MGGGAGKADSNFYWDTTVFYVDYQPLPPHAHEAIRKELKRFARDLNLSDEQKRKLHERLASAAKKLHEYKNSHPDVTRQDAIKAVESHRAELRAAVESFLTPEQLKKWDVEVAKAKEFLGFVMA
jgi:hypothetical protein